MLVMDMVLPRLKASQTKQLVSTNSYILEHRTDDWIATQETFWSAVMSQSTSRQCMLGYG